MEVIKRISNLIYAFEKKFVIILVIMMLVAVFFQFLFRYVFNFPLTWTDETAMYTLAWLTFIGGSMSIKEKQAVAVSIVTDKLSGTLKKIVVSIGIFVALLFGIYLMYLSIKWIGDPMIATQKSNNMQLPMLYPYLSVPVGISFMTVHLVHILFEGLLSSEETTGEEEI